jgi:uncharacterized protein GlcG (DUF336 family)
MTGEIMTRAIRKITLKEAIVGLKAMRAEAEKDPTRPMGMGVADETGRMICFLRMDGGTEFHREMVFRKCYASAQFGETTGAIKRASRKDDILFYNYNQPLSTVMPGGVPIVPHGAEREDIDGDVRRDRGQIGACGAGGRKAIEEDEAIAKIGMKAIQDVVWNR